MLGGSLGVLELSAAASAIAGSICCTSQASRLAGRPPNEPLTSAGVNGHPNVPVAVGGNRSVCRAASRAPACRRAPSRRGSKIDGLKARGRIADADLLRQRLLELATPAVSAPAPSPGDGR